MQEGAEKRFLEKHYPHQELTNGVIAAAIEVHKALGPGFAVHIAQLRSTLKAAGKRVGLLMNFNQATLKDGLKRVIS